MMNKKIGMMLAAWLLIPMAMVAQSYSALWKQVEDAQEKDLPKTAITHLKKIESKARQERAYGQLLKATLTTMKLQGEIAPDSVAPAVKRLEQQLEGTREVALQAVYATVLSKIFSDNSELEDHDAKRTHYRTLALAHPEVLGKTPASSYEPLIIKGKDSEVFGHDLLSVIGIELDAWQWMTDYYEKTGNCPAACLTAVNTRNTIEGVDSLIAVYGDYAEAGELAIHRYNLMLAKGRPTVEKYQWLQESIRRWGKWKRANELKNELAELTHPWFKVQIPLTSVELQKPQMVKFDVLRNVRQLTMRVYRTALQGDTQLNPEVEKDLAQIKAKGLTEVKEAARTLTFTSRPNYEIFKDSAQLGALPAGVYLLSFSTNPETETIYQLYFVSGIRLLQQAQPDKQLRYVVVDATTGQPVGGAQLRLSFERYNRKTIAPITLTCDQQGEVIYDASKQQPSRVFPYTAKDTSCPEYFAYGSYYYQERSYNQQRVVLFTDRSIYRPGQTVQASVIAYSQWGDEVKVIPNQKMTLTVEDAKWKKLTTMELESNEFGTASFEIVLPEDCEVGTLHLSVKDAMDRHESATVRVEEYKRPTYEVTFGGNRTGHFGEVLEAEGTAMMFAGVPVQGANVHYTVEYASVDFKRWWVETRWVHQSEGDITTDDEGKFRVPVALTDEHLTPNREMMRYRIKATVTDVAGESHDAEWTVNATRREFYLDLDIEDVVDLGDDASFTVNAYDMNREKVTVKGKYAIEYTYNKPVVEGFFTSGDTILLPKNLKLGARYTVRVIAYESDSTKVEDLDDFTPYDSTLPVTEVAQWGLNEKFRPKEEVKEQDFIHTKKDTFKKGEGVDLYFTTAETDAYIIYNVYNGKGLIDHQVGVTDGTMKHLHLPYKESWGEGIEVAILYVRNGQFTHMNKQFTLERPDKKLKLEWATFRDKLQPGQQEQWTLTVSDKNGKRVSGAEMMAVLYDASLDRIYSHYWSFGLGFRRNVPVASLSCTSRLPFPTFNLYGKSSDEHSYRRTYNSLAGYEHDRYLRMNKAAGGRVYEVLESRAMVMAPEDGFEGMAMDRNTGYDTGEEETVMGAPVATEEAAVPEENFDNATIRENFAETAFFLPHLVSDKKGNVNIQFTLPESLTEWQFMGFAHTKDVDYGLLRSKAVARKEFMLRPNMPRFVRWGDKAVVASSIINQSEQALKGAVRMRLINPETEEVVLTQEKAFEVEAGKTVGVDFSFDVKEEWADLDCEIIAMSGNVSDGEKNHLPVLSTKKEMVESVPYYIIGNAEGTEVSKTMDLTKLYNENSSTATNRVLKVEYTDNPAWMCIEALRSVKNPEEDDAIDFAASLYANTRLVELLQTFPVMEKHENSAELRKRTEQAETKLASLQNSDGGWSWFKGMTSSFYTTLAVCEHLAKLPNPNDKVKQMLNNGMKYLDRHELDSYQSRLKRKVKIWPYDSDCRYLYVSALIPEREVSKDIQKMREDYLSRMEKAPRDLTIYGAANAAYTFRAFGHVKAADKFVNFLKDYTVEKPGQGRFYATDAAYYSWMDYRIPTQVAAMKAIHQKDKKDPILNDMQLWLLTQKQVQKWDNPMNTIDVADFLLKVSPMETFHENKKPILVVDGTALKEMDYGTINTERDELEGREANLILEGNVLADTPTELLADGVQQLEVKKQTPGVSWGAAYATFLEDVGNLKLYATNELKIERKLYVQKAGSTKWDDFDPNTPLKVGDKVRIRHIITADRDMDFVRVSAQHPACLEPLRHLSGYQHLGGRGGYLSIHDSHFDLFFDWFTRGTSTVDMDYSIVRAGSYQVGVSTVECVYAKQFGGHTEGLKVNVKK